MAIERGATAFVISTGKEKGKPHETFPFAAFKKFDYQLTQEHCKPINSHPRRIYIYKK